MNALSVPPSSARTEVPWRRSGSAMPAGFAAADPSIAQLRRRLAKRLQRALRIETCPPALWLGLQMLALWPVGLWAARRLGDGSDEPLGLVALALLLAAAATGRLACQPAARLPWLAAALVTTVLCTAFIGVLPWLALAVVAALALACAWAAFRAPGAAVLPVLGLLWLALPVVASLQFYVGWPLRLLTAQGSAWLLQLAGLAAEPSGASLLLGGRLVIVDAPCSGVQLAWLGYCAACAAALWNGLGDGRFVRRLPWVGLTVLLGNVLRNTVLVAHEAGALPLPGWAHEAVGLATLAVVCAIVLWLMRTEARHAPR